MTGPGGLQTVNVMVTDVVGSTGTLVRAGADAADAERRRHDTIVRNVVEVFGGSVVKSTGDGALAVLPSADHLVRAGSAVQEAARAAGFPIRVGMSTGDAMSERGDLFGEPVVVASRLCDVCPVGDVLVDAATIVVRGNRHEPAAALQERLMLRGFDAPRDVWSVTVRPLAATRAPRSAEPAIGREGDVEAIRDLLRAATGSALLVLAGEPGIGKTHLARAAVGDDDAALWIRFTPSERDGFVTWCAALDEVLGEIPMGVLAALGPDVVACAAGLLPMLAGRLPMDLAQRADDAGRDPTLDALATVVELVGRQYTVVLDDVQWAGPTALAFVGRLLSSTSGLRLLATSRLPVPSDIARLGARVRRVAGLSDEAVGELLRERGVDAGDVTTITRRADGNPLLALFASGSSPSTGGNPVADAFLALPPDQLEVLGVAGLLGRHIDIVLLEQLTATPAPELSPVLQAAVGAGLLAGDEPLSFVHDLVREAAAAALPVHRRVVLHAAAATALQRRGDPLGAVDHVLRGFGALDADVAVEAVAAGGELLAERLAFEDLLVVATRLHSVVVTDQRCRPRHEAAALLLESWAYELLGDVPKHKDAALAAGRIARDGGADMLLVEAALSRAGYGVAGIPDPDTLELLDAALSVVPDDDAARRARLTAIRAFYLVNYEGRGPEARSASLAALHLARDGADDEALAEVLANRMFVLLSSSDVLEQVALADELRRVAPRLSTRDATWHWRHCTATRERCACSSPTAPASPPATRRSALRPRRCTAGCSRRSSRCGMAWLRCSTASPTRHSAAPKRWCRSDLPNATSSPALEACSRPSIAGAARSLVAPGSWPPTPSPSPVCPSPPAWPPSPLRSRVIRGRRACSTRCWRAILCSPTTRPSVLSSPRSPRPACSPVRRCRRMLQPHSSPSPARCW